MTYPYGIPLLFTVSFFLFFSIQMAFKYYEVLVSEWLPYYSLCTFIAEFFLLSKPYIHTILCFSLVEIELYIQRNPYLEFILYFREREFLIYTIVSIFIVFW